MDSSIAPASSSSRITALDGVRGLAILLVLIWHYIGSRLDSTLGPLGDIVRIALSMTWSGVDLFFVLSGFLIGGILLDYRDSPRYYRTFYLRRMCRILPLYYLWLAVYLIFRLANSASLAISPLSDVFNDPIPFAAYATMTQNVAMALSNSMGTDWLSSAWSLAVEEQFYLFLPPLLRWLPRRQLPYVMVTLIVAAPILRILLLFVPPHGPLWDRLMPTKLDPLLLGVMLAYVVRQDGMVARLQRHGALLKSVFGVLLLGTFIAMLLQIYWMDILVYALWETWIALLYAAFILVAVTDRTSVVTRFTVQPWLQKLGTLAYGLYLIHQPISILSFALFFNKAPVLRSGADVLVTMLALGVTLLLAHVSWYAFEKRFVDWGHEFKFGDPILSEVRVRV